LRRTRGVGVLLPAQAGAFVAILLVLASPPVDAQVVRIGYRAAVEPTWRTHATVDEKTLGDPRSGTTSSVESPVSGLVKRAEEIEAELEQTPRDEGLLANLTRTRIDAADVMLAHGAGESASGVDEVKRQLALGRVAWSEYLKVAKKPSVGLAALVAPALFALAEISSNSQEALKNVKGAASVQKIAAEGRPGKDSWSTLAFYDLFAQRYNAAAASIEKAIGYMNTKSERESVEKKFQEVEKDARQFARRLKSR
jgi:hypothetical protein